MRNHFYLKNMVCETAKPQDFGMVKTDAIGRVKTIATSALKQPPVNTTGNPHRKMKKRKWKSGTSSPNSPTRTRLVTLGDNSLITITTNFKKNDEIINGPKRKIQLTRLKQKCVEAQINSVTIDELNTSEIITSPVEMLKCCTSPTDINVNVNKEKSTKTNPELRNGQVFINNGSNDNNNNILEVTDSGGFSKKEGHQNGTSIIADLRDKQVIQSNASEHVKHGLVITNIVHLNIYYQCLSSLSKTRYKRRYDKAIHSIWKSQSLRTKSPYWSWLRHSLNNVKPDKKFRTQLLDLIKDSVNIQQVSQQGFFIPCRLLSRPNSNAIHWKKDVSKRVCYNLRDNTKVLTVDEILDAERSCKRKVPSRDRTHLSSVDQEEREVWQTKVAIF